RRHSQLGRFSVVAYNMQEQRVIYRADNVERIDFPAQGEAVRTVRLGVVDYRRLQDPESGARFLAGLLAEHLAVQDPQPDAIVIAGPKFTLEKRISQHLSRQAGRSRSPVYYLNFNFDPVNNPWRDAISSALKVYTGLQYAIAGPRDLGAALNDMMLRIGDHQEVGQGPAQ